MHISIKKTVLAAATAGAALVLGTTAASAMTGSAGGTHGNGPAKVVITTNSNGHQDTTNVSGSATFTSPNGPVWAVDNLKEQWTVTACSANATCTADADGANYAVTLKTLTGSHFAEFANPGPNDPADGITSTCPGPGGGPRIGQGTISGTIEYDVNSSAGPDLSSVPATQAPNTSLDTVLSQIFDNNTNTTPLVVGGGHYKFSYTDVCGSVYSQAG